MMKTTVLFVFLNLLSFSYAQNKVIMNYPVEEDFYSIYIQGNMPVEIIFDRTENQRIDLVSLKDSVDVSKINIKQINRELEIRYSNQLINGADFKLIIYTHQTLRQIKGRFGAEITINNASFLDEKVKLLANSGSKLLIENLYAENVYAEISKGGSIQITGKSKYLEAVVNMGGTIAAMHFPTQNIDAKVSLGGEILCFPSKYLDAKVTSGGSITYKGNPEILNQKITLGGRIDKI